MKRPASEPVRPDWDTVVLACRACRKRKRGPGELSGKLAVREARAALRGHASKPRPRILATGCLGLCPEGAIAIAIVGDGRGARIVAVPDANGIADAVGALLAPPAGDPPTRR